MLRLIHATLIAAGVLVCAPAAGLDVMSAVLGIPIPLTPRTWAIQVLMMAVFNNHVLREAWRAARRI